ncbi:uncharacterized protein LAJ45_05440 [Morchella importuna]|uniref:uncharacterized protein n=1 Tax=Morchella importuna TaxID=1174673 RepID=UPI001E8D9033|nr:uncharacterized protein LAJ45_05440 [Morchella importuna]KAH8150744.1 hypothetical protein LAJ45_05440 [Morchella importuna]
MRPFNLILLLFALAVLVGATRDYTPIPISKEISVYALTKAAKLVTPKDKAIFWSQSPPAGFDDMNQYLKKQYIPTSGGKKLIMDLIMDIGGPPKEWEQDYAYWAAMSRWFAAGASGEVVYLIGRPREGFRYKQSVFFQTELPELTKSGSKVTRIVAIDAINLANQRVIWEPGYGHWGMDGVNEAETPADIFEVPGPACGISKMKRAGVKSTSSCPLPGAKGKAKDGKGGTTKGQAAAGPGKIGQKGAAGKGTDATAASKKASAKKTEPKPAAKSTTAASKKRKGKRAGPSRISWDS